MPVDLSTPECPHAPALEPMTRAQRALKDYYAELKLLTAQRDALVNERDSAKADSQQLRLQLEELQKQLAACQARVKELEALVASGGGGGSVPPPVPPPEPLPPPTTPTGTKAPAVLNDRFHAAPDVDRRYFLDKTPPERVRFLAKNKVRFIWSKALATGVPSQGVSAANDMRAQMVIRAVFGGGGTPLRAPVGSRRLYAWGFGLETPWPTFQADEKCVATQHHQGNGAGSFEIKNPPASIEIINLNTDTDPLPILRLVLSLPALPNGRLNFKLGNLPVPGTLVRFLADVKWHEKDGHFKVWRDGDPTKDAPLVDHRGPTCYSQAQAGEGLNASLCNYNPGHSGGAFAAAPAGWQRSLLYGYWLIGDETNSVADMVAAVAAALA